MSTFQAGHDTNTHTIQLSGPPDRVFPLFTPLGEKAWAPEWDPVMLYPASGDTLVGTVFTVHQSDGAQAVWTIADYDPAHYRITYVIVVSGVRLSWIEVRCQPGADDSTQVEVTYTHTALTPEGNAYIAMQTGEFHRHRIESWKTAIDHYLAHGHALSHH
jgi:hypothetical protein